MSKQTPHFFVLGLPKKEDRCANSVYFVRTKKGVEMVVTDSKKDAFTISASSGEDPTEIGSLVSPQGTIDITLNGEVVQIDISQDILDELEAIRNAIVQPPNYIPPSANITFGNPTVVEAGTSLSRIVSATFTQNDAGQVNNIRILRNSQVLVDQPTNQNLLAVGDSFTIGRETVTHTCEISYDEGETKENNLGIEDPTGKIQAGTITANRNIVGRLKIFYGSTNQFFNTGQELRDFFDNPGRFSFENSNNISFFAGSRFHTIAVPQSVDINNIVITTSSFETITQDFLANQQVIQIPDAGGNLFNYNVLTYSTLENYNVDIQIQL